MKSSSFLKIALMVSVALALSGCSSPKKVLYFQDIDEVRLKELDNSYEAVIKKDDILTIAVSGPDKTVTAPYNFTLGEMTSNGSSRDPEHTTIGYLVDPDGNITFPILGKIHVEGMTRNDLVEYLTAEIGKDVKDPIVYVAFRNYKISVLGEVKSPGTYTFDSEKTNVLQALSRAGDLALTAKRDGILLLREENGQMVHYTIDLKSAHLLDSPYFYLQQNDVIYVPPTGLRVISGTQATGMVSFILSTVSSVLSLITLTRTFK